MFSDCRNCDIRELTTKHVIINGVALKDVVRFFHGDGPACELEAGQQKNGTYPCWLCPANFNRAKDLKYMLSLPHLDLKDRTSQVLKTTCSREKLAAGRTKLYSNLKKCEIIDELHERGIKFSIDEKKPDLAAKLIEEMHGVQRLPSLFQADVSMVDLLENYEILGCEPLHDIKNHIANLYDELPHHLSKEERTLFEDMVNVSLGKKDCKRGVD